MPLTKKQISAIDNLVRQAERAKALHMPTIPIPEEMEMCGEIRHGWSYNAHNMRIYEVWQTAYLSCLSDPVLKPDAVRSRTIYRLWDTPEKAGIAMIHEIARECAYKMVAAYKVAKIPLIDLSEIDQIVTKINE